MRWKVGQTEYDFARPLVMGIVNVTPDSFSDGGQFHDPNHAVDHGLKLIELGADILDIGGESTRPNAVPVSESEEIKRVVEVISKLASQTKKPISIDTMKPMVAHKALDAGARIVNDVSGLRDPEMVKVCQGYDCGIVVMHMQGTPQSMQDNPQYQDVIRDTIHYLKGQLDILSSQGIDLDRVAIDPGIGFGKTLEHTLSQLRNLSEYNNLNRPICLGVSRKGFIGQITGRDRANRLAGTLAVNSFAMAMKAAHIIRVHDVAAHFDAVRLWEAISSGQVKTAEEQVYARRIC
jgi:dihydropteroate synthase